MPAVFQFALYSAAIDQEAVSMDRPMHIGSPLLCKSGDLARPKVRAG